MSVKIERRSFKNEEGSVIDISINAADQILAVEKMLGDLKGKAPSTLRNAVNATARKMRTQMARRANKTYVKGTLSRTNDEPIDFKDALEMRKATISTLTARLKVSAKGNEKYLRRNALTKFKVSPLDLSYGKARPKLYKVKVLKSSRLKPMKKGNLKSFLVQFQSTHVALVQRDPSRQYEEEGREERVKKYGTKADMSRIVEHRSPSVAEMLGGRRVYGAIEPEMGSLLQQEIENFVQKTIEGGAKKKR